VLGAGVVVAAAAAAAVLVCEACVRAKVVLRGALRILFLRDEILTPMWCANPAPIFLCCNTTRARVADFSTN
jgi:hypothetical protein